MVFYIDANETYTLRLVEKLELLLKNSELVVHYDESFRKRMLERISNHDFFNLDGLYKEFEEEMAKGIKSREHEIVILGMSPTMFKHLVPMLINIPEKLSQAEAFAVMQTDFTKRLRHYGDNIAHTIISDGSFGEADKANNESYYIAKDTILKTIEELDGKNAKSPEFLARLYCPKKAIQILRDETLFTLDENKEKVFSEKALEKIARIIMNKIKYNNNKESLKVEKEYRKKKKARERREKHEARTKNKGNKPAKGKKPFNPKAKPKGGNPNKPTNKPKARPNYTKTK